MTKNSFVAEVTVNELFIKLSINEVCCNPFQELKNIKLEKLKIFDRSFKCKFTKKYVSIEELVKGNSSRLI